MTNCTVSNDDFGNIIVRGYHGTNLKAANSILNNGFSFSTNKYDWLGKGVYFWQDAPQRAWNWAVEYTQKKYPDDKPVVLCSELDLNNCVDLLDSNPGNDWYFALNNTYKLLKEKISQMTEEESKQLPPPIQQGKLHGWDRRCIDHFIEKILEPQGEYISSVRAAFSEGKPIFENSGLYDLAHVQIAIRNLEMVKNTRIYKQ
jgi:hypothetical protein